MAVAVAVAVARGGDLLKLERHLARLFELGDIVLVLIQQVLHL